MIALLFLPTRSLCNMVLICVTSQKLDHEVVLVTAVGRADEMPIDVEWDVDDPTLATGFRISEHVRA
jgi:hypothetical protein